MKKKNENVQMSAGQLLELGCALLKAMPLDMSPEVANGWIGNSRSLRRVLREALMPPNKKNINYAEAVDDWQDFYKKYFSLEYDFSKICVPEKPEGAWRLLFITSVSLEGLYAKCKELFPCRRWTDEDLDSKVKENERDGKNGVYAVWVKDVQEADEDLKNLSANDIKTKGVTTETLAERLIHELKFFDKTGKHLDVNNVTLAAGSRCDVGDVPSVDWDDDKLHVNWYSPGIAYDNLRARQAVS